ncbi:hypothetical protein EMO92_04960 [Bifidobacterium reuteri]|uniref:Uncharacterized protein n=1 Tax=Bifidobacterium reuteri TaxID=983706 RepID=A0A5J5E8P2_9BIFI|nr:hypothetical protein [Bifidobacterium reuteri]KAA8825592.1 hypothetical protein EMO92_04960 [Bifidobacterium reuteri]
MNGCTSQELVLLSEVNDELIDATQNELLIHALKTAQARFPETTRKYQLDADLDFTISRHINDKNKTKQLLVWKPSKL